MKDIYRKCAEEVNSAIASDCGKTVRPNSPTHTWVSFIARRIERIATAKTTEDLSRAWSALEAYYSGCRSGVAGGDVPESDIRTGMSNIRSIIKRNLSP